jgi:putative oxidoreductase
MTNIIKCGLQVLFALLFFAMGVVKLAGTDLAVTQFTVVGLGQSFRVVSSAVEIVGALCFFLPRAVVFGALLVLSLTLISVDATIAQMARTAPNSSVLIDAPHISVPTSYQI